MGLFFFPLHFVICHIYIFGGLFLIDFSDKRVVILDQSSSVMVPSQWKVSFFLDFI